MAKGVPLTPAQVETLTRVWLATANASEAAREAGCSEASARNYIIRRGLAKSCDLYAQALARAEREHLELVAKARRKVAESLDGAADPEEVAELARAANDGLRAVTATRIAHLKAAGLSAPDRTDVTTGGEKFASVVMLPALDAPPQDVRPDATEGDLAAQPGPSD